MKMSKTPASQRLRILAGGLSILLAVAGIQGCKKKGQEPNAVAPTGKTTEAAKPDAIVVKVNNASIMENQVDARIMKEVNARMGGNATKLSPQVLDQARKMMRVQVIDIMISEMLLDQQVKAAGQTTTDQDVVAAVNDQGAKMAPPVTFDQYKKAVQEKGQNFDEIMTDLRLNLSRQKFLESKWAGKIDVNDTEAKAFYDANAKVFERPEEVRASHILIAPDPNGDPNQAKIAAKDKAEKLLAKIKGGADFAETARTNSQDASASNGGDLGYFARGAMVKPFEDVAFSLEPNKVSDVVETQFGYHIIKVTDHRPAGVTSFDEVKANIVSHLSEQKRGELLGEYLQSLRNDAKIVYTSPSDAPPKPTMEEAPAPAATPQADANTPKPPADAGAAKTPADANKPK